MDFLFKEMATTWINVCKANHNTNVCKKKMFAIVNDNQHGHLYEYIVEYAENFPRVCVQ